MTPHGSDTNELAASPASDAESARRPRPRWLKLAAVALAVLVVAATVAAIMVFVTGITPRREWVEDSVWVLTASQMTVNDETTIQTVYPDTVGTVLCSNGSHLAAQNEDGWTFTAAGSWQWTDEGLMVNGNPVDASWKWDTLTLEYMEGQLLKRVEYERGPDFDIRELAAGVWQGPADMWLDWYKFEGEQIVLAEDGTFELGELSGEWTVNEKGSIDVDIDTFENTMIALFKVEDSNTLSLLDTVSKHSLALLDRVE